jgi:hypothetical protein
MDFIVPNAAVLGFVGAFFACVALLNAAQGHRKKSLQDERPSAIRMAIHPDVLVDKDSVIKRISDYIEREFESKQLLPLMRAQITTYLSALVAAGATVSSVVLAERAKYGNEALKSALSANQAVAFVHDFHNSYVVQASDLLGSLALVWALVAMAYAAAVAVKSNSGGYILMIISARQPDQK